ncbi:hypothetical protein ACEQPO_17560 [Bacillus sp. SL00103]
MINEGSGGLIAIIL